MKDVMKKLNEFHETYECHIGNSLGFPDDETRTLRKNLITEEYKEFIEAEENDDIVEVADALADLVYVIAGTAVSYGIPLEEVFNEVHSSNMSKLGEDGKPIFRESDRKVLKGPNYRPPNVKGILLGY